MSEPRKPAVGDKLARCNGPFGYRGEVIAVVDPAIESGSDPIVGVMARVWNQGRRVGIVAAEWAPWLCSVGGGGMSSSWGLLWLEGTEPDWVAERAKEVPTE